MYTDFRHEDVGETVARTAVTQRQTDFLSTAVSMYRHRLHSAHNTLDQTSVGL